MFSENERETNRSSVDWEIVCHLMRFRNKSHFSIESILELQRAPADKGTIMDFIWTISLCRSVLTRNCLSCGRNIYGITSNDIGPL